MRSKLAASWSVTGAPQKLLAFLATEWLTTYKNQHIMAVGKGAFLATVTKLVELTQGFEPQPYVACLGSGKILRTCFPEGGSVMFCALFMFKTPKLF